MTLKEYDVVELIAQIPGRDIPVGSTGTVLIVYRDKPGVYEVEFISHAGTSHGTVTLEEAIIRIARSR